MKIKIMFSLVVFFMGLNQGYAGQKSDGAQAELDKKCEAAREKKLKPKRDKLIKKCMSEDKKSREECVAYYSTYGDAQFRSTGNIEKRLFDDLPECVKAAKN